MSPATPVRRYIGSAAVVACLVWAHNAAAAPDPDFIDAGPREMLVPYATIDVYQDLSDVDGRTTNALRPSGMSPTYLGFKFRREVDTGGFVGFQIEQTFDPVQGTWNHKVIGDRILTLDANTRWGYLRVGRQFTPQALLMGAEVDAFQAGFWGSPYAVWDGGVPLMLRANAVSWQSVPIGGVSVHGMLAHDAEAADPAPKKQDGAFLKVEWAGNDGEFVGAVVVAEHNRDRSNWRRLGGLGAGWPVWGINWTIGVQLDDRPADRRYAEWALGATKRLGPHDFRLSAAGSSAAAASLGGRVYGVAYVFHMTSVFSLYTSLARLQNARLPGNAEDIKAQPLSTAKVGDFLVVERAGGYAASMSVKNFNSYPEAAETLRTAPGKYTLIRSRQTLDQIMHNEIDAAL